MENAAAFSLEFLGANSTVTGSRHLVKAGGQCVLVDCGLFQGYKPLRLRNWAPFPVDPASIDAILLTHAHLDHSGYIPRLVRDGFKGTIWCTRPTQQLCGILLPDSARLLEEEAGYANKKGSSKHHPAEALYTEQQALKSLRHFQSVDTHYSFEPIPGMRASFRLQGHILGAAAVSLEFAGKTLTFSGDLGRPSDSVMLPPEPPAGSDWIVIESTYGDRLHPPEALQTELEKVLGRVLAREGVVIIPAFAVGRAQLLLHAIAQLQSSARIPKSPVYLNSPMASSVAQLYRRFPTYHRLSDATMGAIERITHVVGSPEESKALNRRKGPMIIVSASGMATGGRVLHHLTAFASDPRNAIILSGFQAGGTRGASLAAGARTLRIYGQDVVVKAEVVQMHAASAHADADEIIDWLRHAPKSPDRVFITHGEPNASEAMRLRIERELHWNAHIPEYLEKIDLR